jgi:hypothetical protein
MTARAPDQPRYANSRRDQASASRNEPSHTQIGRQHVAARYLPHVVAVVFPPLAPGDDEPDSHGNGRGSADAGDDRTTSRPNEQRQPDYRESRYGTPAKEVIEERHYIEAYPAVEGVFRVPDPRTQQRRRLRGGGTRPVRSP